MKIFFIILGVSAILVAAAGCMVIEAFRSKPISLPPISIDSVIFVEQSNGSSRKLDGDASRKIIFEINSLRVRPWLNLDGKVSQPSFIFVVKEPDSNQLRFSLTNSEITQFRRGSELGGGYTLPLRTQVTQHLKHLFDSSS